MTLSGGHQFSRYLKYFLMSCAVLILCATQSSAQAASPSTELKKMFSKMDRQLCRSLSLATCKRLKSQKMSKSKTGKASVVVKSESRKPKPVKPKPASSKNDINKKPTNPKPLPVLKVAKPVVDPIAPTPEKVRIPTPTLKPVTPTKEATFPAIPTPVVKKRSPQIRPEVKVVILPTPVFPPLQTLPPPVHAMPDGTLSGEACYDSLVKLGVKFTKLTTNVGTGLCSVTDAVQVHSIIMGNDSVRWSDQPTLNCGFAFKFASWLKVEASSIIATATGKGIAALGTGPGFQCRGRNGDIGAKLSEHAFGNAVDIERIKLTDGQIIDVKDAITTGAKFQPALAAMRATACKYFTTVLGPGTNAAHATHFHFDLARRGKKGNHMMCQ